MKITFKNLNDDLILERDGNKVKVYSTVEIVPIIDEVVAAALVDLDKRLKALEQAYNNQ